MFNRGRQYATEEELDADLAVLVGDVSRTEPGSVSWGRRLPPARLVVGRFFFIHESQANVDVTRFATYEFLHATFGEYLVAWIIFGTLQRIMAVRTAERAVMPFSVVESMTDERLYALLSFALLSDRVQIAIFLKELTARISASDRSKLRLIARQLFQDAPIASQVTPYGGYKPRILSIPARYALYHVNVLLLNILASEGALPISELFGLEAPLDAWQRFVLLWQSQLENSSLDGLLKALRIERVIVETGARDLKVSFSSTMESPRDIEVFRDLSWSLYDQLPQDKAAVTNFSTKVDRLIKVAQFLCADDLDLFIHGLYPLLKGVQRGVGLVMSAPGLTPVVSAANVVINMLYEQVDDPSQEIIDQVLNPWRDMLRPIDIQNIYREMDETVRRLRVRDADAYVLSTAFSDYGVSGSPIIGPSESPTPIGYWATVISALATNYSADEEDEHKFSSREFVMKTLEQVDIVRLARDEPEAALSALKLARTYEMDGWSADQGLSILALMQREQLAVVSEEEVEYVLASAGRNRVLAAAIEVVRNRWLSAGGATDSR